MNIPESNLPRIVIVGAGFGGLNLAKNLNSSLYQIVLIDKQNYHLFQPLMYQVATAGLEPDSIAYPIRKVFQDKKNIYIRYENIVSIDFKTQIIQSDNYSLQYDKLVLATGAKNNFFGNKSLEHNTFPMKSLVESLNIRSKILENLEQATNEVDLNKVNSLMSIVIIGGGPTGVELAGALNELKTRILTKDYPDLDIRKMQIHLVEGASRILNTMSEKSSKSAYKYLEKKGVTVWTGVHVNEIKNHKIELNNDATLEANLVIWAAGVKANYPELLNADVEIQRGNRIVCDDFLKVKSLDNVYTIGDVGMVISDSTRNGHPMLGSVAMQQGNYLAKSLNGKTNKPFKYLDKGSMATVGRNLAVADFKNKTIDGFFGWIAWLLVHLMLLIGFRNKLIVLLNWVNNYFTYDRGNRLILRKSTTKN